MAGDTDFLALYDELGVAPGISDLDVLKRAYRRRVAQLHPDRSATGEGDPERLQRLNRLYGAALAFEQRYGRLPAAAVASRHHEPHATRTASEAHAATSHERRVRRNRQPRPAAHRNRARYYFALVVVLALAFAIWGVGVVAH